MKTLTCVYFYMYTHAHVCTPSDTHTSMHEVYSSTQPPTDTLTHACLTLTCIRFVYIAAVLPETHKHTDSLLRSGLKVCSFLHFLLLTYTFEISLACTHFLLQAYPLLHAHCHTPTYRPNHFLSSFLFLISFFFISTHTVILAFLFSLSLSPTQFVSCFPTGWAIATFLAHALTGQAIPCLMPVARTHSVPPAPTSAQEQLQGQGNSLWSMRPSGGTGAAKEGLSPWSPDLPHSEPGGTGNVPEPGHLQLCISQNLGWGGLTSAHF